MRTTFDRDERKYQKEYLKGVYPDYDPKYHDAFVERFNSELANASMNSYMINRGIVKEEKR